jgi:lipopolysaccharide/colanic/teichoic acid biosynthesis glycosyltransferase
MVDRHARVLLVGLSPLTARLVEEIQARPELRWRLVGLVADLPRGQVPDVGPWLGPLTALPAILEATRPSRVVIVPADRRKPVVEEPLIDARLRGVIVEDTMRTLEQATGKLPIEQLTSRSLILSDGFRHSDLVPSGSMLFLTHGVSVVAALAGLLLLSPLLALIALAIKIDSRGPMLFRQDRLGVGGRPFPLFKFRTMHQMGRGPSEWVRDNGHRITRVGKWLRRFRLDELPQLVNVLRGEMNLVGPRPHPVTNGRLFMACIPHYRLRSVVRPGITGWAQIKHGYANGLDEETEKMRYDLFYITHRSFLLDLRILIATLGLVLWDGRSHEAVRHRPGATAWPRRWSPTLPGASRS